MRKSLLVAWLVLAARPATAQASATPAAGKLQDVEIRGVQTGNKLENVKPPLNIEVDPVETIRPSLEPDRSLLLAVSPLTVSWRLTHPDTLDNQRVIQPWRLTFSRKTGVVLRVRDHLCEILGRKLTAREAKPYAWNLTIADEEGRVFHRYEGTSNPPEELVWSGQNDQNEWIKAGHSYAAVYTFIDPSGTPHRGVGKPLLFHGLAHQEDTGLHLTLDSSILFGSAKTAAELEKPAGYDLLRSAADLVKRRYSAVPIAVRVFAATKELADTQAAAVQGFLLQELMAAGKNVTVDGARAAFSDQRVEIVLLNR